MVVGVVRGSPHRVHRGGHRGGPPMSWSMVVGRVAIIHCGRVVLVRRRRYCPFLSSIVVVRIVVTVGGALSSVVIALESW